MGTGAGNVHIAGESGVAGDLDAAGRHGEAIGELAVPVGACPERSRRVEGGAGVPFGKLRTGIWPMPTLPLARTVRMPGSYQVLTIWTMTWPAVPLNSSSAMPTTRPALVAFVPLPAVEEVVT